MQEVESKQQERTVLHFTERDIDSIINLKCRPRSFSVSANNMTNTGTVHSTLLGSEGRTVDCRYLRYIMSAK